MEQGYSMPSDSSRMRLLHAAIRTFSKKGFDGASIREISAQAGINSSQIFFYFNDKDGLYLESLRLSCKLVARLIGSLPDSPKLGDFDASQNAKFAIMSHVKMFVNLGLFLKNHKEIGKLQELEHAALFFIVQEMQSPRSESENILMCAIKPHVDHMSNCIRVLRPDLNDAAILML